VAQHHLVGAGLKRDKSVLPREGKTAAHWHWDGIYRGLMRSGEIVTVGPGGMTGMRSVVGIEARTFPIWMNAQILMPGERTQAIQHIARVIREDDGQGSLAADFGSLSYASVLAGTGPLPQEFRLKQEFRVSVAT